MKNILFAAGANLPLPAIPAADQKFARMFSFWDNEAIDDVTERFFRQPLVGTTVPNQVLNGMLNSKGTVDAMEDSGSVYIEANKPFCIQATFKQTATPGALGGVVFGIYDTASSAKSWGLVLNTNGLLQFILTGSSTVILSGSGVTIKNNVTYHIAIERDANNLITLYINGIPVSTKTSGLASTIVNGRVATRKEAIAVVWDMSFARSVIYGAPFTPPTKATSKKYTPVYTPAVAADIVAQLPFRRDDPHNEVNGRPVSMGGATSLLWGMLRTSVSAADTFSLPVDYYGGGDFTYEFKFRLPSMPSGNIGLIGNTGQIEFQVIGDGRLLTGFLLGGSYSVRSSALGLITAGNTYHVVAERVDGVLTVYVNGVAVLNYGSGLALTSSGTNAITQLTGSTLTRYLWDIRVAKRAMYRGVVAAPDVLPKLPVDYRASVPARTLRVGSLNTSQGMCQGFAKNFLFGSTSLSIGELYPQVYWNTTQNRMVRIKALISIGTDRMCLVTAPSNEPRGPNTPTCTNLLRFGGATFDMTSVSPTPTKANDNDNAVYYAWNLAAAWNGDETTSMLQFV